MYAGCQGNLFGSHIFGNPGVVRLATGYAMEESWLPVQTRTFARSDSRDGRDVALNSPPSPTTYQKEKHYIILQQVQISVCRTEHLFLGKSSPLLDDWCSYITMVATSVSLPVAMILQTLFSSITFKKIYSLF